MRKISLPVVLVMVLLFVCAVSLFAESPMVAGNLVIVGGGLLPQNEVVYGKFLELAQAFRGRDREQLVIGIVPAGSADPVYSAESYIADFVSYGALEQNCHVLPLAVKDDRDTDEDESLWADNGNSPKIAAQVLECDAIWFVGGDQTRYMRVLLDADGKPTPVLQAIWQVYSEGAVLGGTSAGAAIMSDPMLSGGTGYGALAQGVTYEDNYGIEGDNRVFLTPGLGFFPGVLVDQHFSQRARLGRLVVACADQGISLGFGIDEDTALVVYNSEGSVQAIGEGGVTIVDMREAQWSVEPSWKVENARISLIEKGDRYSLQDGSFSLIDVRDTTLGYEYYDADPSHSEMNSNLKDILTLKLIDNLSEQVDCFTFEWDGTEQGSGFLFRFSQDANSEGFWGKINGKETYAVLNVRMDILPFRMKVELE
ncbi:MAG TPA: cyanophycinase [Thermotogota bacterium]|nr:cyanophycinase [Thermotogota bacterium]